MQGFRRLLVVGVMAAGLVSLVIQVERRYAPHTLDHWRTCFIKSPSGWGQGPLEDALSPGQDALTNSTESMRATAISAAGQANRSWSSEYDRAAIAEPVTDLARLHGGGNIDPSVSQPCLATSDLGAFYSLRPIGANADGTGAPPGPLAEVTPARPLAQPGATPFSSNSADAADRSARQGSESRAVQPLGLVQPSSEAALPAADDTQRDVDPFELMRQLRDTDEQTAGRARSELVRRGCTEIDLEVARRLFDPDPEVRKQLARMLPRLQSVDAAPVLLWLSRDQDAEVRLTSITVMATTGDPALLAQVEEIARQDADPRVREQIDRISQQRDLVGRTWRCAAATIASQMIPCSGPPGAASASTRLVTSGSSTSGGAWCGLVRASITSDPKQPQCLSRMNASMP